MPKSELIKDIENMEEVMNRTANRCDFWQDRCVYAIAKAVWHILQYLVRHGGVADEVKKDL
jgi:hypothetical protein